MSTWTLEEMRRAVGGRWLAREGEHAGGARLEGVSVDTRTIRPGELFVALRGQQHDGHAFVAEAIARGAVGTLVERGSEAPASGSIVGVPDTYEALCRLAKAHRDRLEGTRVVAVTGSNGKTTTVRLIEAVLRTRLSGTASQKSFNNEVGTPLTVLRAKPGDAYLVCEVGMNAPGEIGALASIVEPDVAVITGIGRAHLEGVGTLERVAEEKSSLLRHLRAGGLGIAPADEPLLTDHLRTVANLVTFGETEEADLRLTGWEHMAGTDGAPRLRIRVNDRSEFESRLLGRHNARNMLAAIGVARRFGLDDGAIRAGLASARNEAMRFAVRRHGGVLLVNDAYNANPDSMRAAIDTFRDIAAGSAQRVVVMGDMLELGEEAAELHEEAGRAIAEAGDVDLLICVGPLAARAGAVVQAELGPERALLVASLDDGGAEEIARTLRKGDAALLKGSRSMRLERIEQAFLAHEGAEAASQESLAG